MVKDKKGITMITLVITIVVMLIIAGITVQGSQRLLRDSELKTEITNMLLIQARAEVIYDKNQFDDTVKLVGTPITNELATKYSIPDDPDQLKKWYIWDNEENVPEGSISAKSEIEDLKIKLKSGEFYIVNYEDSEVIYSEGYRDSDGNVVYSLSKLQNISNNK